MKHSMRILLGFLVFELATAAPYNDADDNSVLASSDCPRIISRTEWGAREARARQRLTDEPVPYVVVHHGGIAKYCFDQEECSSIVRSYQNLHIDGNGWSDIGYQFVIGEDGNIYEGRGWDLVGAHAPGYNTQSIGICIIGDYNEFLPNEAALKALRSLMHCGVSLGKVREDFLVIGHRQTRPTECPGQRLYDYVKKLPNWTDNPVPVVVKDQRVKE